jgi:hypothetical protein
MLARLVPVNADTGSQVTRWANGSTLNKSAVPDNNTLRRVSTTYPDGRVVNVLYGDTDSVNDHFNLISALQVDGESEPLVQYTYAGVAWQVEVGMPQPGVELTYKQQPGEPVGDAGDIYNGYDRFNRTVDIRWQTSSGS